MSFSFSAAGSKADVIRTIRSHHVHDAGVGQRVRALVTDLLEDASDANGYMVKAQGHSDARYLTLNLEIQSFAITPAGSELGLPDGGEHA